MDLKNIFKRKKGKAKEIDFSNLVIGPTRSGRVEFKDVFSNKLVELYRDNKKYEIITVTLFMRKYTKFQRWI